MWNKLKQDVPIYLNGFAVGMLFFRNELNAFNTAMYVLCCVTFFWYGKQMKNQKP